MNGPLASSLHPTDQHSSRIIYCPIFPFSSIIFQDSDFGARGMDREESSKKLDTKCNIDVRIDKKHQGEK